MIGLETVGWMMVVALACIVAIGVLDWLAKRGKDYNL